MRLGGSIRCEWVDPLHANARLRSARAGSPEKLVGHDEAVRGSRNGITKQITACMEEGTQQAEWRNKCVEKIATDRKCGDARGQFNPDACFTPIQTTAKSNPDESCPKYEWGKGYDQDTFERCFSGPGRTPKATSKPPSTTDKKSQATDDREVLR